MYQAWGDDLIKNQIPKTHVKKPCPAALSSTEGQIPGVHWLAS